MGDLISHPRQTEFRVFLFTDMVDSVGLKQRHGDDAVARAMAKHDDLFRSNVLQFHGKIRDNAGDGFFVTFDKPSDAVGCALMFLSGLARIDAPEPLRARAGIHIGETSSVSLDAQQDSATKLVGLHVDLAARVMGLAAANQILLTRLAFDSIRQQSLKSLGGMSVAWAAHGPYCFQGIEEPLDVFEVGITGLAPMNAPPDSGKARRAVPAGEEESLGWRPAPGQDVPDRAGWTLNERLGDGKGGELWLATYKATGERGVFRFCFDMRGVRTLRREMRHLKHLYKSLERRDDIVRLIECQIEKPPVHLQFEFVSDGDLFAWARREGGLANVPLDVRIEFIARVADSLAAVHAAGIMHLNLKPSNILTTRDRYGQVWPRLTDFSAGRTVTDLQLSVSAAATVAGPAGGGVAAAAATLYAAPELLTGAAATPAADIFALGVLLYQFIIGDLTRPLAPGWEEDVPRADLRAKILSAAHGHTSRRIANAADWAKCLRSQDNQSTDAEANNAYGAAHVPGSFIGWKHIVAALVIALIGFIAGYLFGGK